MRNARPSKTWASTSTISRFRQSRGAAPCFFLDLVGESECLVRLPIIETAIPDVLRTTKVRPSVLWTGHVALDIDTKLRDNSRTKKDGSGRT